MRPRLALSILLFSFIFSGCASLSKNECANANWDAIGYRDGSRGKSVSRFDTHEKACTKHGFKADFALYKDGHQRGLEEVYCKPGNGYRLGLNGRGYNNVCPAGAAPEFLAAYHYGRDIYKVQRSYDVLQQKARTLKADLAAVDERIAVLEQNNHEAGWDARAGHVKQLNRERRDVQAQYDRIKLTRPMSLQSQTLVNHLHQESVAHDQRVERIVSAFTGKSAPKDYNRRQFRRLVRLSNEKGQIESQIQWLNRGPGVGRDRRQRTKTLKNLQSQLRGLFSEIHRQKNDILRYHKNRRDHSISNYEARLERLMAQAEYQGALAYHSEVLDYMMTHRPDQSKLYLLIDAHFEAELMNLDQRIEYARHRQPTEEELRARMLNKRELRDAQRQHTDYQNRLADLEQQMDHTLRRIEQLKASSRY